MKKKFLLSACLALSLVLAGCSSGGNSTIKGSGPVEGVRLTQDTFNVDIGETYFLKSFVEFTPTYPANQTYTLETSDEEIFTVDSDQGSFTGVSVGIGTLTLTTNDGGYTASASVIVGGGIVEEEPDDAGDASITYENYTIVFTLYDATPSVQKVPSYGSLYIAGDYDGTWDSQGWWNWGSFTQLTETEDANGNVAYALHLDSVIGGSHEFKIYFVYDGDEPGWTNDVMEYNDTFTIATTATSGGTQYVNVLGCYNLEDKFPDKSSIVTTETNFYILFVDTGSASSSFSWNPWISSGKNAFNSTNTCEGTVTTTGTTSKTCIYNGTVGILESGTSDYFYIYDTGLSLDLSTGTIQIPVNETGFAVYVCEDSFASPQKAENSGTWYTGVSDITSFIATL